MTEDGRRTTPRNDGAQDLAAFTRRVLVVVLFGIGLILLWRVRVVLILIVIAAVLAAGIAPVVKRVRTMARLYLGRRIRRGTAVLIVYFPFLAIAIVTMVLTVPKLLLDAGSLSRELPPLIDQKLMTPLERYFPMEDARAFIYGGWQEAFAELPIFNYVHGVAQGVASVVAILFMVVYMLIDAERLRNLLLLLYPAAERGEKRRIFIRMSRRMSSWLSGQLLLALIIGVATFVILLALRIPYALPLAILAAIGELVPVIGPILGAIPAVIVALFQSPWQFWAVLAAAILIQQVENYLLVPRLMGKKVSVAPLGVFIAFMMGLTLLGIIGAMLAVPTAAVIQVAFEEGFVRRRERRLDSDRPGSLTKPAEE
ncbi:MAG TPA: AI-2E family transporter [Thermoanaerobaculia bacterium]|nr:AI-2E family transporter [Thermoanaerobaculia bacterium]